jgi:hypothetical protein
MVRRWVRVSLLSSSALCWAAEVEEWMDGLTRGAECPTPSLSLSLSLSPYLLAQVGVVDQAVLGVPPLLQVHAQVDILEGDVLHDLSSESGERERGRGGERGGRCGERGERSFASPLLSPLLSYLGPGAVALGADDVVQGLSVVA